MGNKVIDIKIKNLNVFLKPEGDVLHAIKKMIHLLKILEKYTSLKLIT